MHKVKHEVRARWADGFYRVVLAALAGSLLVGCSEREVRQSPDGGRPDGPGLDLRQTEGQWFDDQRAGDGPAPWDTIPGESVIPPDGPGTLLPCSTPGKACNAGNPCAINPVCGTDLLCHPSAIQSCDDGIGCTQDTCLGLGMCSNKPKTGYCLIGITSGGTTKLTCFKTGDTDPSDPCWVCTPSSSQTQWSPAYGGTCDDANTCTKNDTCVNGTCLGTDYSSQCVDAYSCTKDLCDGKGGCLGSTLLSNYCLISGICYKDGQGDAAGCNLCDVSKSQSAWTPLTGGCTIAGMCYASGTKDSTGCGECDVSASTTSWTVKGNVCLIGGSCYQSGQTDSTGCATCDPTKSKSAWTPLSNYCLVGNKCYASGATDTSGCFVCDVLKNPAGWTPSSGVLASTQTFESGSATGWTLTNSDAKVGWVVSNRRAANGSYALYYGDPVTGTYDSGATNSGTATMPAVTLTAGKKAVLSFLLYADIESSTSYDTLAVLVSAGASSTAMWQKSNQTMKIWQEISVDLSTYAGQTITIQFKFDTVDSAINSTEGVFLDDVTVAHGC